MTSYVPKWEPGISSWLSLEIPILTRLSFQERTHHQDRRPRNCRIRRIHIVSPLSFPSFINLTVSFSASQPNFYATYPGPMPHPQAPYPTGIPPYPQPGTGYPGGYPPAPSGYNPYAPIQQQGMVSIESTFEELIYSTPCSFRCTPLASTIDVYCID